MDKLQKMYEEALVAFGACVPNLLSALVILVVGYFVALIVAKIVKSIFTRCKLNEKLSKSLPDTDAESAIGTGVFYILMVFVLVAFFQKLNLELVTRPLNAMLETLFKYLPQLLGAGVLALVAWAVATVARTVVKKSLEAAKVDDLVNKSSSQSATPVKISGTISNAAYGLVILLFLPSILEALGMQSALAPFNKMIEKMTGFLPNIISAAVVIFVGIFVAQLVRQIVKGVLSAAGADALADRAGIGSALGKEKLSGLLSTVCYIMILLPFVVASLDALQMEAVSKPATMMLAKILNALPNIFGAMLVLGISYVVSTLVSGLLVNILEGSGFDRILVTLGLQKQKHAEAKSPSHIVGALIIATIMMYASVEAARLLGFDTIAAQLADLIVFCGHIVMALIVLGVGLFIANFASDMIQESDSASAEQIALGVRVGVIVLFAGMALRQTQIANSIIDIGYASILGGVGIAFALAVGLSFGLGGKDTAGAIAKSWHEKAMKKKDDESKAA